MSDDLPAGRELDALIAEKVMGYRWLTKWMGEPGEYLESPDGFLAGWRRSDGGITGHLDGVAKNTVLRPYSTDIAAAWEVVEKITSSGRLMGGVTKRLNGKYSALVSEQLGGGVFVMSDDVDTAPLAICRAALKAVETRSA
jgi:hypothetical protein